ncbi:MAG: glycine cleavage T C-terminal barrel domain-containing protein [Pseudomonadota bacterium]
MAEIGPNTRLRASPYHAATLEAGATAFTPYNNMLLPVSYGDPMAEYRRLMEGVSQWDVAVQRQVELAGRDAAALVQMLCARDLSTCAVGQGRYAPVCDHRGVLLNDPVVLKLAEDRFWLSIGDNNIRMWARAIASERRLDVRIDEPDVSPMAIQGPRSDDVAAAIFGDWVRALRPFRFEETQVQGIPLTLARSGYSKQGGFELYLMDGARGGELWNIVREAGGPWDIGPGAPNVTERIESGLLSYGGDTDDLTNPFEVRLDRFVSLDVDDDVLGIQALRRVKAQGARRRQLGVMLDEQGPQPGHAVWHDVFRDGRRVGSMTNGAWSPRVGTMIGYVLVEASVQPGERVEVDRHGRRDAGVTCELPFF